MQCRKHFTGNDPADALFKKPGAKADNIGWREFKNGLRPIVILDEGDAVLVVVMSVVTDRFTTVETFLLADAQPLFRSIGDSFDLGITAGCGRLCLGASPVTKRECFLTGLECLVGVT